MTIMNVLPKCFPHYGIITPFNLPGTFVYTSIDRYVLYQLIAKWHLINSSQLLMLFKGRTFQIESLCQLIAIVK